MNCSQISTTTKNLFFFVTFISLSFPSLADIIYIGTGNKNALAYPTISSICYIYNKYNIYDDTKCKAVETLGSKYNLDGIIDGKFGAGIVKADIEYNAYNGIGSFKDPHILLRNIIGLYDEYLTLLVRKDSNIDRLYDIKNRRVYIGNIGSGSRILVDRLFHNLNWNYKDFKKVKEGDFATIYNLFCNNKIDASLTLIGHPNKIFERVLKDCPVKLLSFSRAEIEQNIEIFRHLRLSYIPKGTYQNTEKVPALSSQLILLGSERISDVFAYNFARIISQHQDELIKLSPNLKGVSLFSDNINIIPVHQGIKRFLSN